MEKEKQYPLTVLLGLGEKQDIDKMVSLVIAKTGNRKFQDHYREIVRLGVSAFKKKEGV